VGQSGRLTARQFCRSMSDSFVSLDSQMRRGARGISMQQGIDLFRGAESYDCHNPGLASPVLDRDSQGPRILIVRRLKQASRSVRRLR